MNTATPELLKRGYVWPPRATTSTPPNTWTLFSRLGWIAQLKVNDSHCVFDFDYQDGKATLVAVWDRHNGVIKHDWTLLREELENMALAYAENSGYIGRFLFDGGLLHHKHAAIKETVAIWDVLFAGEPQIGISYSERHVTLCNITRPVSYTFKDLTLGKIVSPHIFVPDNIPSHLWSRVWNEVIAANKGFKHPVIEGFMLKDLNAKLTPGLKEVNNNSWMVRSRVQTGRHVF